MNYELEQILRHNIFLENKRELKNNKEDNQSSIFEEYNKKLESQQMLRLQVVRANNQGDLYVDLGTPDVIGIVPNSEVTEGVYAGYKRNNYLNKSLSMMVIDVDRENKEIKFSVAQARKHARELLRKYLINEIKKGNNPKLKAKIQGMNKFKKRVLLDLGGVGILGYIPLDEWDHKYVQNISTEVKPHKVMEVAILRHMPEIPGTNMREAFICSRKQTLPDPWDKLRDQIQVNDVMVVTCIDRKERNWFGTAPGIAINLYCEYPSGNNKFMIEPGKQYKVKVYRFNPDTKLLRARPFEVIK